MWMFKEQHDTADKEITRLETWRDDSLKVLDVLKVVLGFKTKDAKITINTMVSQAHPIRKEMEERSTGWTLTVAD